LLDVIRANPEWSIFYEALTLTGYDSVLNAANSFTVFAPENSTWEGVNMNDLAMLTSTVSNHIAYEKKLSSDPALRGQVQLINGKLLTYDPQTQLFFGASKIISADHVASNGVVHGIDKVFAPKKNIWEYIRDHPTYNRYSQVKYIAERNRREMDMVRSIRKGVNPQGQPVYDTAWVDVNDFLKDVPLNDETQELTYIVLQDNGFSILYDKYLPYFAQNKQLASFNVCRDLVFRGRISNPTQFDSISNLVGVTVRLKGATLRGSFEASNGRVYVLSTANILLRDKVKPVIIEGEDFTAAADPQYVFTRYKPLWAKGAKDIMLACSVTQQNRVGVTDQYGGITYSTVSKTFLWSDKYRANMSNFWIEYKADVYATGYKIYYVAYDDIEDHYSDPAQRMRLEQKLFISMPGAAPLSKGGVNDNADAIANNYLGNKECFVGIDTAGVYKETQLLKWRLTLDSKSPQFIGSPLQTPDADVMLVSNPGTLMLWLCNTARATTASAQGMLFLDYIKLVPVLPEEEE
jgi:hypothetical protein